MIVSPRLLLCGAIATFSAVSIQTLSVMPTGKLETFFLDVGQGDATMMVTPSGYRILTDGGPDSTVLQKLQKHLPLLSRRIDLLVLTHPDSDHSHGVLDVLRRYDVRAILLTGMKHETETYLSILSEINTQNIPVILPDPALDIRFLDGTTLNVVWPFPGDFGRTVESTNNAGVVFIATAGDRSVLMTGDIEAITERKLLMSGQDIHADLLKVAHHGSKTSSGTGFLLAAAPKRAVISAGRRNQFGHPHPSVLGRLSGLTIPVHNTAESGEGTYEP